MKTDRELLDLAAKAAGYEVRPHPNRKSIQRLQFVYEGNNWNPLTDDGDALRLAVKLGITVTQGYVMCTASAPGAETHHAELVDGDAYAATRRAIVRAAAAIGEQMQ